MKLLISIFLLLCFVQSICGNEIPTEDKVSPEIIEKLGDKVNLDLKFKDEDGAVKTLKEIGEGKPIVLALGFYRCTSICGPFLSGVANYVDGMRGDFKPGRDFSLVTISINPEESSELAKSKKKNFYDAMNSKVRSGNSWRFMVGEEKEIMELTQSIGFIFAKTKEGDDYRHKSSLIVLSPDGKVVRYLPGYWKANKDTTFNFRDLDFAVSEAYKGRTGPTLAKILNVCFKYDALGKTYAFRFLPIVGASIMLIMLTVFITLVFLVKKPEEVNLNPKVETNE